MIKLEFKWQLDRHSRLGKEEQTIFTKRAQNFAADDMNEPFQTGFRFEISKEKKKKKKKKRPQEMFVKAAVG